MLSKKKLIAITLAAIAGAALIVTQTASSKGRCHRMEGAWALSGEEIRGYMTCAPSDPLGRTATAKLNWVTVGTTIAGLQASYGADASTDGNYAAEMIGRDTVQYSGVFCWIKTGCPNEIKMIFLHWGTLKFTGPDTMVILQHNWAGYLPARDADGYGLPDNMENPDFGQVGGPGICTRQTNAG